MPARSSPFNRDPVIVGGEADRTHHETSRHHQNASIIPCFAALTLATTITFAGEKTAGTEEPNGTPSTPKFHQTVTVLAQPIENAGAAISIMEREEIVSSGVTTLSEALRGVAGLHVTDSGSRGGVTTVEVRGGDPTHTLVLLDGVPLNDGTNSVGDVCDLASISSDGIERIEIVRGPVSSFYGSRALAGVVQIFSRRAGGGTRGEARANAGRFDARRLGASLGSSTRKRDGILSLIWEKEHGRVGNDRYSGIDLRGQTGLPILGRDLRVRARYVRRTGDDYSDASGGPLLGDGELRHSESDESSLSVTWAIDARDKRRQAVDVAVLHRELDRESPAVASVVPSSIEDARLTRLRLGWSGTFALHRHLSLQSGLDLEREDAASDSALLLGPEVRIPGDYAMRRTSAGAFAGIAGHAGSFVGDLALRFDAAERHAAQFNPRASLSYQPMSATWRARSSIGRGYKLPSFYGLASPPAIGGNPDLRPETSAGVDLGVDLKRGPVTSSLTLFQSRYDDLIDFDFSLMHLVNRARVRSRGIEASLAWALFSSLTFSANATHIQASDKTSDEPILHQPAWSIHATVNWSPTPNVRLGFDARSVSRSFDRQIPVPERDHVSGHAVVGGGFSWKPAPLWRIEARCDNLTNTRYETLIGFPGPRRALRVGVHIGG